MEKLRVKRQSAWRHRAMAGCLMTVLILAALAGILPIQAGEAEDGSRMSQASVLTLTDSSDAVDITDEVRQALAGTSVEAKVTSAGLTPSSMSFYFTFEYEGVTYQDGSLIYDDSMGSEDAFNELFAKSHTITDEDGTVVDYEELAVNDTIVVAYGEDGYYTDIVITGHENIGVLRLLAGGALMPVLLLAAVCLAGRGIRKKQGKKLPAARIALLFFLEMPVLFLLIFVESAVDVVLIASLGGGTVLYKMLYAFFVAGLIEELGKFFVLFILTWRSRKFTQRYEGIVSATAVSMGFSALENVFYLMIFGASVSMIIRRSFFAAPGHCACGIIMGYFYGRAKEAALSGNKKEKRRCLLAALLIPVLLHGCYDVFANSAGILLSKLVYVFTIAEVVIAVYLLIRCRKESGELSSKAGEFTGLAAAAEKGRFVGDNSGDAAEDGRFVGDNSGDAAEDGRFGGDYSVPAAAAENGRYGAGLSSKAGEAAGSAASTEEDCTSGQESQRETCKYCPACGRKVAAGSRFCGACGHRLASK